MLSFESILMCRILDRLTLLREQIALIDRYADIRICFSQDFWLRPIVALVDRVNDGEQFVILERALQHLLSLEVLVPAGCRKIRPGGRDDQ